MALQIESSAFSEGSSIPVRFTCDGPDRSPPLQWKGAPQETKSFALIMDDPDAPVGIWVHWVIYNIPAKENALSEGTVTSDTLPDGIKQGVNDFQRVGYGGPCPPRGGAHRYSFKLYALDSLLLLGPKATKADLEKAMKGHIIAQTQLMGRYARAQ